MGPILYKVSDDKLTRELALPGTHNSTSYALNYKFKISNKLFQFASNTIILRPFLSKWTKCQSYTILQQLNMGVRYLDIRVSKFNDVLYTSHSFACVPLNEVLDTIYKFLSDNPTQFVIAKFEGDWENRKNLSQDEISQFVSTHNGISSLLYDGGVSNDITVGEARGKLIQTTDFSYFSNQWFNTSKWSVYKKKLAANLNSIPENNGLHITQCTSTPQTSDILLNPLIIFLSTILLALCLYFSINNSYIGLLVCLFLLIVGIIPWFIFGRCSLMQISYKCHSIIYNDNIRIVSIDFIDPDFCKRILSKTGDLGSLIDNV